jgi:hypothetical protein
MLAALEARWQCQQRGGGSVAAKWQWRAVQQRHWQRELAVAGLKTTAGTAMVGDTVNNQLKGAAEETTAAAMVTAAESATGMETVMDTATIRTVKLMLKAFFGWL